MKFNIPVAPDFNFEETLIFLNRSPLECLHTVTENEVTKALLINGKKILFSVITGSKGLTVTILNAENAPLLKEQVKEYITEWLGLNDEVDVFYKAGRKDIILRNAVNDHKGLRLIGMPDLFEALTWSIIGQQINLTFAYTLKKRFVETYGSYAAYKGKKYYILPLPAKIAKLEVSGLRNLQMTEKKSEYIIGIAKMMSTGQLSKEALLSLGSPESIKAELLKIRGVGEWTAEYVMMKCLRIKTAFPVSDVGFHNAVKDILGMSTKPSLDELRDYARSWKGFEAYAVFYLWRSLIKKSL